MIYTITLNPAIDRVMVYENFKINHTNRAIKDIRYAAGKGIHTSKLLSNYGIPNIAIYIEGKDDKWFKKDLEKQNIFYKSFTTKIGHIRENIKIIDKNNQTECNSIGLKVDKNVLEKIVSYLKERTNGKDIVIVSGSIPKGLKEEDIVDFIEQINENDVNFIFDISNISILLKLLKFKPLLIKPNEDEFQKILKEKVNIKDMLKMGAQNIFLSKANKGGTIINNHLEEDIKIEKQFKILNSAGAGDSLIAGFVIEYIKSKNILKSAMYGVICGTATAISEKIASKKIIKKIETELKWNKS